MDRSIRYPQEVLRSFDILSDEVSAMKSIARLSVDLFGSAATIVAGTVAAPTAPASLSISLAEGRIYQRAVTDGTAFGSLNSDSEVITQQGTIVGQTLSLSTSGLSAGQSRWALVQGIFSQADAVAPNDPTGGVLNFYDSVNPQVPLIGPDGDGSALNTVRQGVFVVGVIYGTVATTGSEIPPTPTSGYVPLYLIDLAYGQTAITSGQILAAGPSVGSNVPSDYPRAPFLAGLLASHHNGKSGQAPQIKLDSEVQGTLGLANLPASSANSGGGLCAVYTYGGNPNGHVAGVAGTPGTSPPDLTIDPSTGNVWTCTTTGNAASAVWSLPSGSQGTQIAWGGTAGGTANALTMTTTPSYGSRVAGQIINFTVADNNTGAVTVDDNSIGTVSILKRTSSGLAALSGGELVATDQASILWDGTQWQLTGGSTGACAALNIGTGLENDGAGNLAPDFGTTSGTVAQGNDTRIANALNKTDNLSDIADPATALNNLSGVATSRGVATGTGLQGGGDLSADRSLSVVFGTTSGTVMQGNDSRVTGALTASNNLSDLANAATARANLGVGSYVTSGYTPSPGATISESHGLGTLPTDVTPSGYLKCISANAGYVAGDRVNINALVCAFDGGWVPGVVVSANDTKLEGAVANASSTLQIISKTDGSLSSGGVFTPSKWQLYLKVKFN